jgi:hypothetical protein
MLAALAFTLSVRVNCCSPLPGISASDEEEIKAARLLSVALFTIRFKREGRLAMGPQDDGLVAPSAGFLFRAALLTDLAGLKLIEL